MQKGQKVQENALHGEAGQVFTRETLQIAASLDHSDGLLSLRYCFYYHRIP